MQEQIFSDLISRYSGISSMIREYSYQEVLGQASKLFSVPASELEQIPLKACQRDGRGASYQTVLRDVFKNIAFYDWTFEQLADETSKLIFGRLTQYQVLPDPLFLEQIPVDQNPLSFEKPEGEEIHSPILKLKEGIPALLKAKKQIEKEPHNNQASAPECFCM